MPMNSVNDKKLEEAIVEVFNYFNIFKYAPSTLQIYTYIQVKVSKKKLEMCLVKMEEKGTIQSKELQYTGERIWFKPADMGFSANREARYLETEKKFKKARLFFLFIARIPYLHFAGVSGSCAVHNARRMDDIDVFIISAPGGMWLARLTTIVIAKALNVHRKKGMKDTSNMICLNLFFDGLHLAVPKSKRNLYTAHEVVQIVPVVVRGGVYNSFLYQNRWVAEYFPNIKIPRVDPSIKKIRTYSILGFFNRYAKKIQLHRILQATTTERISDEQLWFFPDDFQKKIEKRIDILHESR